MAIAPLIPALAAGIGSAGAAAGASGATLGSVLGAGALTGGLTAGLSQLGPKGGQPPQIGMGAPQLPQAMGNKFRPPQIDMGTIGPPSAIIGQPIMPGNSPLEQLKRLGLF